MRLEDALVERQGLLPSHKSTRSIDSPSSAKKNKNIPTAVLSALLFLLGAIIGVYLEGHQSSTRNRIPENWGSYETGFATEQLRKYIIRRNKKGLRQIKEKNTPQQQHSFLTTRSKHPIQYLPN